MYGPSDMYGDLSLEDVDEFEGLEPANAREIHPGGRFLRDEVRSFDRDFEDELGDDDDEPYDPEAYWSEGDYLLEDEEYPEEEDDGIEVDEDFLQ